VSFILKDSGKREDFSSGAVRDVRKGKGRFDLVTPVGLRRVAVVYEKGAEKYAERNWEKGMPMSRCMDSALRHLNQYKEGLRAEDHLAQACWNILTMMHFEELRPDLNDLPRYQSCSVTEERPKELPEGNPLSDSGEVSAKGQNRLMKFFKE